MKKEFATITPTSFKAVTLSFLAVTFTGLMALVTHANGADPTGLVRTGLPAQQGNTALEPALGTVGSVLAVTGTLTAIVTGLIFIYFFWNLGMFIMKDGEQKEAAKDHLLWSVVGIAIFSTLWGAVAFLRNITGIGNDSNERTAPEDVQIPRVINRQEDG